MGKMNRWNIPKLLEDEIRARDETCVYCRVKLVETVDAYCSRKAKATWEHIINDARIITRDNIARCCVSCNSSKGTKLISNWIDSTYCKQKGINRATVAPVVKKVLRYLEDIKWGKSGDAYRDVSQEEDRLRP